VACFAPNLGTDEDPGATAEEGAMNGGTLLLVLGAAWACIALVRVLVGVARRDREPTLTRPICEPRSTVTVLRDGDGLAAAAERALRSELSTDESIRRRVERYAAIASACSENGTVLEFPPPFNAPAECERSSA